MPTATEVRRIDVHCTEIDQATGKPCTAVGHNVPENRSTQWLGMHKANVHKIVSDHPVTAASRSLRQSDGLPQLISKKAEKFAELLSQKIKSGAYFPNQRLVFATLQRESGLGLVAVRTGLMLLSKRTPPLTYLRNGFFYVQRLPEVHGAAVPRPQSLQVVAPSDEKPSTKAAAEALLQALGTKYSLQDSLPSAKRLGEFLGFPESTMYRGMQAVRNQGFIDMLPGRRDYVVIALPAKAETPPEPEPEPEPVPEPEPTRAAVSETKRPTVHEYIVGQILDGTYAPGELLPSPQKMATLTGSKPQSIYNIYCSIERNLKFIQQQAEDWRVLERAKPVATPVHDDSDSEQSEDEIQYVRADEVMPMLKVLYEDWHRATQAEELGKRAVERVSGFETEIKRLRGEVAEWRGKYNRSEEDNADLRGRLARQNGRERKVVATFGPDFRNTLGMSEADARKIKQLMEQAPGTPERAR